MAQEYDRSTVAAAAPGASCRHSGVWFAVHDFCRRERRWLWATSALVIVWVVELYLVQSRSLVSINEVGERFARWAPWIRLVADVAYLGLLVLLLGRKLLAAVLIVNCGLMLGLLTYFEYFARTLSLMTVLNNYQEGMTYHGAALLAIPTGSALALVISLLVKLGLLFAVPKPRLPWPAWFGSVGVLLAANLAIVAVSDWLSPLDRIKRTQGVGRLGVIHGYLPAWSAEYFYLYRNRDQILSQAQAQRSRTSDNLTPLEGDIPIRDRLVIIQAESLDQNVIGHRVGGQEVTPFLNRLREQSMYFRARMYHLNGSCDSDATVLTGFRQHDKFNIYSVLGFQFTNCLPEFLGRYGFKSRAMHGNRGDFYRRRTAYQSMGFERVEFLEELVETAGLTPRSYGIADADVLRHSSLAMRHAQGRTCHFIITLTSHIPYSYLDPQDEEMFPGTDRLLLRYFNSIRYLDHCLRDYVASLPGESTVVIYADHPTEKGMPGFAPDVDGIREYIPCFIHDTSTDLSKLQRTRGQPVATDGSLHLVDVVSYLRGQVAKSRATTSPTQSETSK